MRSRFSPTSGGFTLIEMMIALIILSVSAIAIFGSSGRSIAQLYALEQRTLADWVAQDYLTQLRLQRRLVTTEIPLGRENEQLFKAGRLWDISVDTSATAVETMRRVEVSVAPVENDVIGDSVYTATAFMGRY